MRNAFILIFSIILFTGCKKDKKALLYEGTWELTSSFSGLAGIKTTYPAGNGNLIVFSGNKYERYSDHKMIKSGTFSIVQVKSILSHEMVDQIDFDDSEVNLNIELDGDILSLGIDAYDAGSSSYKRINKNPVPYD